MGYRLGSTCLLHHVLDVIAYRPPVLRHVGLFAVPYHGQHMPASILCIYSSHRLECSFPREQVSSLPRCFPRSAPMSHGWKGLHQPSWRRYDLPTLALSLYLSLLSCFSILSFNIWNTLHVLANLFTVSHSFSPPNQNVSSPRAGTFSCDCVSSIHNGFRHRVGTQSMFVSWVKGDPSFTLLSWKRWIQVGNHGKEKEEVWSTPVFTLTLCYYTAIATSRSNQNYLQII